MTEEQDPFSVAAHNHDILENQQDVDDDMPEFMKNSLAKHGIVGRISRTKAEPIFEEQQEN